MSLIPCYECGQNVSTTAKSCAKCGAPQTDIEKVNCIACNLKIATIEKTCPYCLTEQTVTKIKQTQQASNPEINPKKSNKTVLVISGSLIIAALACYLIYNNTARSSQPFNDADKEAAIKKAIEDSAYAANASLNQTQHQKAVEDSTNAANALSNQNVTPDNQNNSNNNSDPLAERKNHVRSNWSNFITAQCSDYKQKVLGGISDLYITAINKSEFKVEYMMVCISYIKLNGDVYETQYLEFNNIAPNTSQRQRAPDSKRGATVGNFKILKVQSNNLGLNIN